MTGGAIGSELPLVNLRFWVTSPTAVAILWPWLKGDAWMAIRARNGEVFTGELVVTLAVVIEYVLPRLKVAVLALRAELLLVHVVLSVTADGGAVGGRLGKLAVGVALRALRNPIVQPK